MSRHRPAQSPVLELPKDQKVKLECFDDMVLVLPDKQSETTPGGIVLPEIAREQGAELRYGRVVCVGPGKMNESGIRNVPDVEVNDRVIYSLAVYGGGTIEHEGKKLDLVAANSIYVRVRKA